MAPRIVMSAAAVNGAGAEKLFEEQKPGDFVGEGEFRERPEQLCAGLDRRIQPVGAADDENHFAVEIAEHRGEGGAGELPPLFRKHDDGGAPLPVELLEDRLALPLDGGIRQLPDFEFRIGAEPLGELVTARLKRAVLQPADDDDLNQHGRLLLRRAADHRGRRRRTAPA